MNNSQSTFLLGVGWGEGTRARVVAIGEKIRDIEDEEDQR